MKIRILVVVGCLIALTCTGFAQDVIVTKDSKRINAKVEEVNVDNIKYRNFDNLEGPTYVLPKSDILSILYQNGQVETFGAENQERKKNDQKIQVNSFNTKPSMRTGDPLLYRQYKTGKRMKFAGITLTGLGVASGAIGLELLVNSQDTRSGVCFFVGGIGAVAGGICLFTSGHRKKSNALTQYYSLQPSVPHFQFNIYSDKVGVAYVF